MKQKDNKISFYFDNNKLQIEQIVKDYNNYIRKIIKNNSIILSEDDVDEIVLDVFMALWKNQNKLDINKCMSSYIGGVTNNLIKYKLRQNKRFENIDDYENISNYSNDIELISIQNEKEQIISEELDNLKTEDKNIFIEYYYSQKSINDLSKYFNMSKSKIKSKLYRIRKRLYKILKKRGYDFYE